MAIHKGLVCENKCLICVWIEISNFSLVTSDFLHVFGFIAAAYYSKGLMWFPSFLKFLMYSDLWKVVVCCIPNTRYVFIFLVLYPSSQKWYIFGQECINMDFFGKLLFGFFGFLQLPQLFRAVFTSTEGFNLASYWMKACTLHIHWVLRSCTIIKTNFYISIKCA